MIRRHQAQLSGRNAPVDPRSSAGKTNGKKTNPIRDWFRRFAHLSAQAVGSPWSFFFAISIILIWAITGPLFGYSDTWQLVINTATTIITFLMVFLIQNTQNRDARAIHLKLDELLKGVQGARNRMIDLEKLTDEEMDQLQKEFERVRKKSEPLACEDPQKPPPNEKKK